MSRAGTDWGGYLGGVAGFAGTLFALVLAARQIRGRLGSNPHPAVSRALLVDSIAVTVELGAAASLALLYGIEDSLLFSVGAILIAVLGILLSSATAGAYLDAISKGEFNSKSWDRSLAWLQTLGNLFPLTCYVVVVLYASRVINFDGSADWGYAAAVSWLTFSGIFQAIAWYARIWETEKA